MNTEQRESARVARHKRLNREDMAVPLAYLPDRPVWESDLDLTFREKVKIGLGSLLVFVWMLALLAGLFIVGASPTP